MSGNTTALAFSVNQKQSCRAIDKGRGFLENGISSKEVRRQRRAFTAVTGVKPLPSNLMTANMKNGRYRDDRHYQFLFFI